MEHDKSTKTIQNHAISMSEAMEKIKELTNAMAYKLEPSVKTLAKDNDVERKPNKEIFREFVKNKNGRSEWK